VLLLVDRGGFAAAVNWGHRIGYNIWMPYPAAILVAHITGIIGAFVLAKLVVFTKSTQSTPRSVFFVTLVNLVATART
jgi:putative flippase GtrA